MKAGKDQKPPYKTTSDSHDPRPAGLIHIAWVSLAMLALCIPLIPILGQFSLWSAIGLPVFIIFCAIGCSILFWSRGNTDTIPEKSADDEIQHLNKKVSSLEKRLEDVETINAFDESLHRRKSQASANNGELYSSALGAEAGRRITLLDEH